jgi:hypothetical protein
MNGIATIPPMLHAKVFGSETAVRIITDLMRVVGVDSYDHDMPLGGLLVDALVLATIDGERLASDELGSLKIKNRVDNLAYLAHATDRMQAGKEFMGFRGVHRRFNACSDNFVFY